MDFPTTLTLIAMAVVAVVFTSLHLLLRRVPFEQTWPRERYRWPVWNWYGLTVGIGLLTAFAANLYWNARTPMDVHPDDLDPAWSYDVSSPLNNPDPEGVIEDSEIRRVRGVDEGEGLEIDRQRGRDERSAVDSPDRVLVHGQEQGFVFPAIASPNVAQAATPAGTPASAAPVDGDAAAATPVGTPASSNPVGEGEPAWANPGGTPPIPDPLASPLPVVSPIPTQTPEESPTPVTSPAPTASPVASPAPTASPVASPAPTVSPVLPF